MTTPDNIPAPTTVRATSIRFVSIYEPSTPPDSVKGRYGLAFPWQDVPEDLQDVFAPSIVAAKASSWGLVNVVAYRRPMVFGQRPDCSDLVELFQRCQAMNLSLSALLAGQAADCHLTFWHKSQTLESPVGVALNAVTIDPSKIRFPGPLDDVFADR